MFACIVAGCGPTAPEPPASLVLLNGRIYTVDPAQPWVSAVAIERGRFVHVGDDARARAYIGPGTETIDLDGAFVMPGINDTHAHA